VAEYAEAGTTKRYRKYLMNRRTAQRCRNFGNAGGVPTDSISDALQVYRISLLDRAYAAVQCR
jgi:hypothetical protein